MSDPAGVAADQLKSFVDRIERLEEEKKTIAEDIGEMAPDVLRKLADALRGKFKSGVIVLGSRHDGKAAFVAAVSEDLVAKGLHAGKLIGQVAKIAGGGGGGQPAHAQAGGKDAARIPEAIRKIPDLLP